MIRRRVYAIATTVVLLLGSGTLVACENETQQEVDKIKEDVEKGIDELEKEINEGGGGGNN